MKPAGPADRVLMTVRSTQTDKQLLLYGIWWAPGTLQLFGLFTDASSDLVFFVAVVGLQAR